MIAPFSVSRLPRIEFGAGSIGKLPTIAARYGKSMLLVTGSASFRNAPWRPRVVGELEASGVVVHHVPVSGEPSPRIIDDIVGGHTLAGIQVVTGIGGGSVLDTAKAVAGLLNRGDSVMEYLEGVGPERRYAGPPVPFIAIPTTAGTGSEATKNAVISVQGEQGFKKSFRDERLVAEYAIVDPDLLATCTPELIAANGMDALTQLMESYLSIRASAMTDALAWSGMTRVRDSLLPWFEDPSGNGTHRSAMAYAALISGITLAQTGLGSVHGLASPLGAFFPIPHGVVCGTLVATATRVNIDALRSRGTGSSALSKYVALAELFCKRSFSNTEVAWRALVETLEDWTRRMRLPTLRDYGATEGDIDRIVANSRGSSMKTNPVVLTDGEIAEIVRARL